MHISGRGEGPPLGFLDAAAGQPLLPAARAALEAALADGWADPAALHHAGRRAGMLLDAARSSIAASLGVPAGQVLLADSPAAAIRLGIAGLGIDRAGPAVAAAVEQALVLDALGADARLIGVDGLGRVDRSLFVDALRGEARLACLQSANREVGTTQPVREIAEAAAGLGVPLFVDAGAAIGHGADLPVGWTALAADPLAFGSCAGVGILLVRPGWRAPLPSARGWIGGTPNIPAAVAAAAALEWLAAEGPAQAALHRALIDRVRGAVAAIPEVQILGDPELRLPHVFTCSVLYASGEALVTELDRRGLAAASGSACVAEESRPSHVLAAMGAYTGGNLRICLPYDVSEDTIDRFIAELPAAIDAVRELP